MTVVVRTCKLLQHNNARVVESVDTRDLKAYQTATQGGTTTPFRAIRSLRVRLRSLRSRQLCDSFCDSRSHPRGTTRGTTTPTRTAETPKGPIPRPPRHDNTHAALHNHGRGSLRCSYAPSWHPQFLGHPTHQAHSAHTGPSCCQADVAVWTAPLQRIIPGRMERKGLCWSRPSDCPPRKHISSDLRWLSDNQGDRSRGDLGAGANRRERTAPSCTKRFATHFGLACSRQGGELQ